MSPREVCVNLRWENDPEYAWDWKIETALNKNTDAKASLSKLIVTDDDNGFSAVASASVFDSLNRSLSTTSFEGCILIDLNGCVVEGRIVIFVCSPTRRLSTLDM